MSHKLPSKGRSCFPSTLPLAAAMALLAMSSSLCWADDPKGSSSDEEPIEGKIAITDFQASVAFAESLESFEMKLTVLNTSKRKLERVWLEVRANGVQRFEAPPVLTLPPGTSVHKFKIRCRDLGFNYIEAFLENPKILRASPLEERKRFATVKIEERPHYLVVDGDYVKPKRRADGTGDPVGAPDKSATFYLNAVLTEQADSGTVQDLEGGSLFCYPCIYLSNVPELSDAAVANLERYVQSGGGLCVFLGKNVKPEHYNKALFKEGKGVFPVPLDPDIRKLIPEGEEAKKKAEQDKERRLAAQEPNLWVRNARHPMFAPVYERDPERVVDRFLMFFDVERYFAVDGARLNKLADADKPDVLFSLPNRTPVGEYRARTYKLVEKLPIDAESSEKFRGPLKLWQREVKAHLVENGYQHADELARAIDKVLNGRITPLKGSEDKSEATEPELAKFWADPDNAALRKDFQELLDDLRYGDPFLVSRPFGSGQVAVCLSTANGDWNNWPRQPILWVGYFPALHKHISSLSKASAALCGKSITITADPKQYGTTVKIYKLPSKLPEEELAKWPSERDPQYEKKFGWTLVETAEMIENKDDKLPKGYLVHTFTQTKQPGVYVIVKYPRSEDDKPLPERRAIAVNVDVATQK